MREATIMILKERPKIRKAEKEHKEPYVYKQNVGLHILRGGRKVGEHRSKVDKRQP